MKTLAKEQQQYLNDFLPEYLIYNIAEHKILKQNIGYAFFGPPKNTKNADAIENNCYYKTEDLSTDVVDIVDYDEKAKKIIDKMYDKIRTCVGTDSKLIYCGIIYNMIFRPKKNVKKSQKKEEKNKEVKTEEEKKDEELLIVSPVPIFKIRKSIQKKSTKTTKSAEQENAAEPVETLYETWYIDSNARVYKNWTDYIKNNNLPACTMVLPKDGFYQPDPIYPITEDYSTVWLEITESPACTWKAKILNGMDIASNVVGFGTVGLSVASMFTPLAPVVVISGKLSYNRCKINLLH